MAEKIHCSNYQVNEQSAKLVNTIYTAPDGSLFIMSSKIKYNILWKMKEGTVQLVPMVN